MSLKRILPALLLPFGVFTTEASAALLMRDNGMVYDTVLNITWLTDASYAKTSGYHHSGFMSWDQSKAWVSQLNHGGLTGWRLARVDPTDPTCSSSPGYGHGCQSAQNEIGHMLFVNLGLRPYRDDNNQLDPSWSGSTPNIHMSNSFVDPSTLKTHSISNLIAGNYWADQKHAQVSGFAWYNGVSVIGQNAGATYTQNYAWAVIDGDVAPAPVSSVGTGLLGLLAFALAAARGSRNYLNGSIRTAV